MTFFMHRLAEALGGEAPELPMPAMRPSAPEAFIIGSDRHVALRAYAEQLVSEANAVIAEPVSHLILFDEVGGDELAFTITCNSHAARVATRFAGGHATGQIVSEDLPNEQPFELSGTEALPDLIIRLCLVAGLHNSESAHLI
jgi:hypothetical protein